MKDFLLTPFLIQTLNAAYHDLFLATQHAHWLAEHIHTTCKDPAQQKNLCHQFLTRIIVDHEPIQYILGSIPFCSIDITLKPPILIPRPETEEWVDALCTQIKHNISTSITILDIGTGSGAIALAIAHAIPNAQVYAVDILAAAVALAQDNKLKNNISNCTIMESNLFEAVKSMSFDLIVSNPPYISASEYATLDASVTKWEDKNALVADANGFAIIQKIIDTAPQFLKVKSPLKTAQIPQLWIEIGYNQGQHIKEYLSQQNNVHAQIKKDYAGNDRIFTVMYQDII